MPPCQRRCRVREPPGSDERTDGFLLVGLQRGLAAGDGVAGVRHQNDQTVAKDNGGLGGKTKAIQFVPLLVRELDAATTRTTLDAAAKKFMRAKAEMKRLQTEASA